MHGQQRSLAKSILATECREPLLLACGTAWPCSAPLLATVGPFTACTRQAMAPKFTCLTIRAFGKSRMEGFVSASLTRRREVTLCSVCLELWVEHNAKQCIAHIVIHLHIVCKLSNYSHRCQSCCLVQHSSVSANRPELSQILHNRNLAGTRDALQCQKGLVASCTALTEQQ